MKPPARVSPLIARQHAHLEQVHTHVARSIHAAYRDARRAVTPALQRFTAAYGDELARVRADDAENDNDRAHVSLVWLHTAGHLNSLRPSVLASVRYAATRAQLATMDGQRQGLTDGQIAAGLLIAGMLDDHPFGGASGWRVARSPVSPVGVVGVSGYNHLPLAHYFDTLPPNAWDAVEKSVNASVANGVTSAALLAGLVAALGSNEQRALLIGEQETTNAYRAGVSATFAANAAVVGAWMWVAQPGACDECAAMHGTIHDASESLDSHPRCRCMQQPLDTATPFPESEPEPDSVA